MNGNIDELTKATKMQSEWSINKMHMAKKLFHKSSHCVWKKQYFIAQPGGETMTIRDQN
jgi:hypothetical protein